MNVYKEIVQKKIKVLMVMIILIIISFIVDVMVGSSFISLREILLALVGKSPSKNVIFIVWSIRLPIASMAIVIGASLGIAGAEMQTILRNPLASPYTIGVSAAAGFGAALALVLDVNILSCPNEFIISVNAFIFALISSLIIYFISKYKGAKTEIIVLMGIALLFLFNALTAFLQYFASENEVQTVVFWLFGSLAKASWLKVSIILCIFVISFTLFIRDAWKLTAFSMGDEKAQSLGVDLERMRLKTLIIVSVLTATAVCFVGTIGFIGLAGPHLAQMLVGDEQRYFIPVSALSGGLILSLSSIGSKMLIPGAIFPIGIITSLIGVPFFILLIIRKKG